MKIRILGLLVFFLLYCGVSLPLLSGLTQDINPSVLMVISPADAHKKEALESITNYYHQRGIRFKTALNSDFSGIEGIKRTSPESV
jgi:hypothetical protein